MLPLLLLVLLPLQPLLLPLKINQKFLSSSLSFKPTNLSIFDARRKKNRICQLHFYILVVIVQHSTWPQKYATNRVESMWIWESVQIFSPLSPVTSPVF